MNDPVKTIDIIDRLPFELQARLESDKWFGDIPVVVMEEGNFESMLAAKQATITEKNGKIGVAVVVVQLTADDDYPELAFGPLTLLPVIQVLENVELNRGPSGTKKSARTVARKIRDLIKPLRLHGLCTEFEPDKPVIRPVPLPEGMAKLIKSYSVHFKTFEADDEQASMVATPAFEEVGDPATQFALSCSTEGAQIWFTTDDSYPAPQRGTSRLYTGPVDVPAEGLIVRAAAYLDGSYASQVNRAVIVTQPV